MLNKKAFGFMDTLLFCLAMVLLIAIITYIFNPFNILGSPTQYITGNIPKLVGG